MGGVRRRKRLRVAPPADGGDTVDRSPDLSDIALVGHRTERYECVLGGSVT